MDTLIREVAKRVVFDENITAQGNDGRVNITRSLLIENNAALMISLAKVTDEIVKRFIELV